MRSLTVKLMLAFLGIGLISIVIIVLVARWNTGEEFRRFISDRDQANIVTILSEHHQANNSWEGIEEVFSPTSLGRWEHRNIRFTLTDLAGKVIFSRDRYSPGGTVPREELEHGIPILSDGNVVGFLLFGFMPPPLENPQAINFIQRINTMLIVSALTATGVALLLGMFLSRSLTRPLRELTHATQEIAGGNLGLQVVVRSRDELGDLAQSFNKMSADLARSTNTRKQMTADIAHELRTPLSLILGHAEAVHDGVLPPCKENFELIREEAMRLEHLVEDLRTLSLADAGELSIQLQAVSPKKLLADLQSSYQVLAQQKGVSIHTDTASDLPAIQIDPVRMTQVLANLLDNALRHTPKGGQIDISASSTQNGLEISVQDSGPGIAGEEANRIFERFYRADASRTRNEGGSGLGLAIAKSIVEMHQGRIWAQSTPGQGLKITIQFPIAS